MSEHPIVKFCYIIDSLDLSLNYMNMQKQVHDIFWKSEHNLNFDGYINPYLSGKIWQNHGFTPITIKHRSFQQTFDKEMKWLYSVVNWCLDALIEMRNAKIPTVLDFNRTFQTKSRLERGVNHWNLIQILGKPAFKGQPVMNLKRYTLRMRNHRQLRPLCHIWM